MVLPRNGFLLTIATGFFVFNNEKLAYKASVMLTNKKKNQEEIQKKYDEDVMKWEKNQELTKIFSLNKK
eukprot:gene10527-3048_t